MRTVFDYLHASFWAVTCILSVIFAVRYKKHIIPPLAAALSVAWEISSLIFFSGYIHILWAILDVLIFVLYIIYEKRKIKYVYSAVSAVALAVFLLILKLPLAKLYGFFSIILITSSLFFAEIRSRKDIKLLDLFIAVAKLASDCFAWLVYSGEFYYTRDDGVYVQVTFDRFINAVGILVLIMNTVYLFLVCFSLGNSFHEKRKKQA